VLVPQASPLPATAAPSAPGSTPAGQLAGLRLLVIDNEPTILDGMKLLLEGWGCVVVVASGIDEALQALRSQRAPDVVIADYHLDHGNGLTAVSTLRERA